MDEGILIEIAQRRRKLEEAIEEADAYLGAEAEQLASDFKGAESIHDQDEKQDEIDELDTTRRDLESCAEACRDDMTALMEEVRKGWDKFGPVRPVAAKSIP